jgi:signal transduction histidine kinase
LPVINAKPQLRRLFRLRTILLLVMLSVLFLPLGSLFFFRFYENQLVRQTELELIMQSAVLSSVYRELIGKNHVINDGKYTPLSPQLDFSKNDILPRRPAARALMKQLIQPSPAQFAGMHMQNILKNSQKITLAGMRILDEKGLVVAGTGELGQSLAHVKEVRSALKGRYTPVLRERISDEPPPSIASISRGTGVRVFTAYPIMDQGKVYGVVYLSRTPQNILKHLYSIKEKVFLISLLLLALTGLFVLFISSRISRPIRELIEQTQKVTKGELQTVDVLHQPGTYELSKLSNSFAEMSQTLNERSNYIQKFASHVSHEFKTPLTSMQGALELLWEHGEDMPEEQRMRFLKNLQEDTSRMERLVNGLLEQARADSLTSSPASCDFIAVLNDLKTAYKKQGLDVKINVQAVDLKSEITAKIARQELQSILENLFRNSLQHGADRMDININLSAKNKLVMSLHDNGSGISDANCEKVFTPFFTTRRDDGGTGLGLGIIQSLLKASHGHIECIKTGQGALFEISLPVLT